MPQTASNSPGWGSEKEIKNISEKVGKFLAFEIDHKSGRIHHGIHHNFTTKDHRCAPHFSKTTLENTSKTAVFPRLATPSIFSENYAGFFEKFRIPSTWKSLSPALST
jgi:hypothetical protein